MKIMKRKFGLIRLRKFIAVALLLAVMPVYAMGVGGLASEIGVTLDGGPVDFPDQQPMILGGRAFVPVRGVFEHLGFEVGWEPDTLTAVLTRGGRESFEVRITVGSAVFTTNGVEHRLDVPAMIIPPGRTMLPIRAVLESVGYMVDWDGSTRTVIITSAGDYGRDADNDNDNDNNNEDDESPGAATPDISEDTDDDYTGTDEYDDIAADDADYVADSAEAEEADGADEADDYAPGDAVVAVPEIPGRRLTEAEISAWRRAYDAGGGANEFELEVIRLVNIERAREGASPLTADPTLMMAARFKAQSMHDLDYFAHDSPVYGRFVNISREVFGFEARAMGENLAWGQATPEHVVRSWMASPGHRANILNPAYNLIGVGFHEGETNGRLWAQKFSS